MLRRTIQSVVIACLVGSSLWAANDPFVGKWKLNQSKSKITGEQLKIEAVGDKKYRIGFGDVIDTVTADGTDQPVHFGQTKSITEDGPGTWKITYKKDGRVLDTSTWTLSQDGKTLNIDGTAMRPDGSTSSNQVVARRIAGTLGFPGTWQSTSLQIGSPVEYEIQPYEGDGLSFITPAYKDTLSMKFDGKEYSETGPDVAPGSVSSGRRVNERTLEITDKVKDEVLDTTQFKVSPDGKTLTLTVHEKGQPKALTIVYDRE